MSLSLKSLFQLLPDVPWGLLSEGYCQVIQRLCTIQQDGRHAMPYTVKTLISSPRPKKASRLNLGISHSNQRSTKFVQIIILG